MSEKIGYNGGFICDPAPGMPELEYWLWLHRYGNSRDKGCCNFCGGNGCEECDYTGYKEESQ